MKRLNFLFIALIFGWALQSCVSDGSCNLEGTWKVKSTDVQSGRLSPEILEVTKAEIESKQFNFLAEGKLQFLNTEGGVTGEGTWTFDEVAQKLVLEKPGSNPDIYQLTSCSSGEFSATQRAPEDPAQEAMVSITTVFEKVK